MIKSYQFFQILQRFYKEREKTLIEQSMKIEELRKIGLRFITGCYKALQNDNHFFFKRSFCLQDIYWFRKLVRSTIFAL